MPEKPTTSNQLAKRWRKTLVLETSRATFWRKSRKNRSFWRLAAWHAETTIAVADLDESNDLGI